MGTKCKIMDFEVDLLTEETLKNYYRQYLSNDSFNVLYFMSTKIMQQIEEYKELKNMIEESDLLLPGEKPILSMHHVDILETGGMVVSYKEAFRHLRGMGLKGKKIYLIVKNKEEAKAFVKIVVKKLPDFEIVGLSILEDNIQDEVMINEVNGHAPDVLLVSMDSPVQESWIHENKIMLNAKLGFIIGGISDLIVKENKEVPQLIAKLHMTGLYNSVVKDISFLTRTRSRIIRKKVADYNNKKEEL